MFNTLINGRQNFTSVDVASGFSSLISKDVSKLVGQLLRKRRSGTFSAIVILGFLEILFPDLLRAEPVNTFDAPRIVGITSPSEGIYRRNRALEFEIQFDKPVVVVGVPSLPLAIGVALREGKYLRGSGGQSLWFQVIPSPGDQAPAGVRLLNTLLTVDGSSIKSRSGKPANLILPEVSLKHVVVSDPSPLQDDCNYSTSINGEAPPLLATFAKSSEITSDVIMTAGEGIARRTLVIKTTRAAGTRAPIHEHEFSGTTTVVQGEMTLFMEGHPPVRAVQGESYFMPPGHKMTGVNTGPGDAILFDSYILPPYARHWRPLEPGFVKCLGEGETRH